VNYVQIKKILTDGTDESGVNWESASSGGREVGLPWLAWWALTCREGPGCGGGIVYAWVDGQ